MPVAPVRLLLLPDDPLGRTVEGLLHRAAPKYSLGLLAAGEYRSAAQGKALLLRYQSGARLELAGESVLLPERAPYPRVRGKGRLICNAGAFSLPCGFEGFSGELIGCGMGVRDTVTLSSLTAEGAVVALQRELWLDGVPLGPAELTLLPCEGASPYALMAAGICLLLLGLAS